MALTLALVSGGTDESEDKWINNYADLRKKNGMEWECIYIMLCFCENKYDRIERGRGRCAKCKRTEQNTSLCERSFGNAETHPG